MHFTGKLNRVSGFKQEPCLKASNLFNAKTREAIRKKLGEEIYKLSNNAFYGKTWEIISNRRKLGFFPNYGPIRSKQKQSKWNDKIIFAGAKTWKNFKGYCFKPKEVMCIEPI